MNVSFFNSQTTKSEGERCREEILNITSGSRCPYGEADLARGQKIFRSYLNANSFIDRPILQQSALLRDVLLPPFSEMPVNKFLRACCSLEVLHPDNAKCKVSFETADQEFLKSINRVKAECDASARLRLEELRRLPDNTSAEIAITKSAEAIADANLAYGADSRRTKKFVKEVGAILKPATELPPAESNEVKISSHPTAEEARGALAALEGMTGLTNAKLGLRAIIAQVELNRSHLRAGMAPLSTSSHLIFAGPPGTGKTTAARLFAHAMKHAGALRLGQVVEVSRSDLVGQFIGQTEAKTRKVLDSALGGVLFVDEAYTLMGKDQDFGPIALNEILSFMENNRNNLCVIFAGYKDRIDDLLSQNNGLRSRFKDVINFDAYSSEELRTIFKMYARKMGPFHVHDAVLKLVIPDYLPPSDAADFANAREVRNLLEKAVANRCLRLITQYSNLGRVIPIEELKPLYLEDFPRANTR